MRILLDEGIPKKLKQHIAGHDCRTVADEGWAGKSNGELLALAEKVGFQVFLTFDRGIEYQQNLKSRNIAIVLIRTESSRLSDLLPHVAEVLRVLVTIRAGQFTRIGAETTLL